MDYYRQIYRYLHYLYYKPNLSIPALYRQRRIRGFRATGQWRRHGGQAGQLAMAGETGGGGGETFPSGPH